MSDFANEVKEYYNNNLWDLIMVEKALELGRITQMEFNLIVNK